MKKIAISMFSLAAPFSNFVVRAGADQQGLL